MRQLIVSVGTFFLTALICKYTYLWFDLKSIFGVEPTYLQWIALELLINLLVVGPLTKKPKETNDPKGSKISFDLP